MANRSFNLTAELNVRGPSNLRVIAADIRRQLGSIDVGINPVINANANRNITNLNNNLRTLNATLAATQTSATNAANAIRNFSQAINSVGTRNINQTLNNAATAAQTLGTNTQNAGRNIAQASTQMEEFGRQSALAVRRFAAFSIVTTTIYSLINAVNSGVKAFISFDKEFVRLQQVTGESAKSLRGLSAEITRLSTSLGVGSEELTTVAVTLAQAGLSANETRKALQALARSALAPSFDDLNSTVEGSIALMRQFGISANQLEGALGSINAVAAKFAVEAGDLIAAIQRTGGVFATASRGVSEGTDALNEFLAVFTSIRATTRESAETIATGLRTIFTRIQRESTITALQTLGIELRNVDGQFVGAYEAVRRLSEGLSRIDPRSREFAAISEELGGFRQIGKVIPLIQQFATAQQALKVAQQGQASLAKDSATAQLSVANQIAKVREEFTALVRSIGESESFRSFVRLSLDLASALIKLADSAKTVLPALTAIAAFKGVSALTQFGRGFGRGLQRQSGGGFIRAFASGGYVPGTGNRDTVPAMLTPGEFVIRKKAVEKIGVNSLANLNRNNGGPIPTQYFNSGGQVQKFMAGKFVVPKARGIKGAKGSRGPMGFKPLNSIEYQRWAGQIYDRYDRDPSLPWSSYMGIPMPPEIAEYAKKIRQYSLESGGAGLALGRNEKGLEVIAKFGKLRAKKAITEGKLKKTQGALTFSAAGLQRGPKAPPGQMEKALAAYEKDPEYRKVMGLDSGIKGGFLKQFEAQAKQKIFNSPKPILDKIPDVKSRLQNFRKSLQENLKGTTDPKDIKSLNDQIRKASTAIEDIDQYLVGGSPKNAGRATHFAWAMRQAIPETAFFAKGGGVSRRMGVFDFDMTTGISRQKETPSLSGFRDPKLAVPDILSATPTRLVELMKKYGAAQILTARSGGPKGEMKTALGTFFKRNGVFLPSSSIATLGDQVGNLGTAEKKARALYAMVKKYGSVDFFDDDPANIDAAKMVRGVNARKVALRNSGGYIQKFKEGKKVNKIPDYANRKEVKNAMRANSGSVRMFGLAGLLGGVGKGSFFNKTLVAKPKGMDPVPVKIQVGTISKNDPEFAQNIDNYIRESFGKSIKKTSQMLGQKLQATTKSTVKFDQVIDNAGFQQVVGSVFEGAVSNLGAPFFEKSGLTKALDFPFGLGNTGKFFNIPGNIPADVTRTVGSGGKGPGRMIGQIERFLESEAGGLYKASLAKSMTAGSLSDIIRSRVSTTPLTSRELANNFNQASKNYPELGVGKTGIVPQITPSEIDAIKSNDPKALNKLIRRFGGKTALLGNIFRGMATGGSVQDTVPALLTPGEFVINKKAASRIGSSRLHQLNRADKIQGFNKGGVVQRFANGKGVTPAGIGGNISQRAIQQSADMEAAIEKIMMNLEKAAKSAQDAAYRQARSQGKTAKEALDIGRQQATAVVNRLAPSDTLGGIAASRVVANMGPTGNTVTGSGTGSAVIQMSKAGQQFAMSLQSATTPLQKLTQAATQAGTGLLKVGKSALSSGVQKIGGGVLGMMGLGRFSTAAQQPGARFAAGRQAVAARRAGGMAGGGMGGMGAMALTMAGGIGVDMLSKAFGGEETSTGRTISAAGGGALNMAATGAMIGGMFGPLGAAIGGASGAVIGFTMGMIEAGKANEEYAQNQRKLASEQAMEKSGAAITKFAETGSATDRAAAISAFKQASEKEAAFGAGVKRQGAGFFTSAENLGDFAKRKAETQQAGAQQAEQFLAASMMKSGKTFDELSKSMNPAEFEMLAANIAEADETYAYFQAQRAEEIAKLRASGRTAEADALLASTNEEQKTMAQNIAKRKLKEAEAAAAATKAAHASKSLAIAIQAAALSFEKAFDAMGQALNKVSFDIEDASASIDEMISGQTSLVSRSGSRAANILANPEAYSAAERQSAMVRGAQIMGPMGGEAMRIAELGPQIEKTATRIAVSAQAGGASNKELAKTMKDTLSRQIEDAFGVGSPMAESAIKSMNEQIDKAVEEAGAGPLDVQNIISNALSPVSKVSEQAAKTIQQANEVVSQNLKALGEAAQKVAELEQKRIGRTAALAGMQAQTSDALIEALGGQLSSAQKARTRVTERATRVGVSPAAYGSASLLGRRQQLLQQQEFLTNAARRAEAAAPTSPRAARDLVEFQAKLATVNQTLADVDNQLEELPQMLQEQIGDVLSEIQARTAQLEAKKEAGAGLAEKIVTSTPQELQGMASTYNLLNNTLKGNITTIKDSQVAQKAYFEAIRSGKTAQEAMNDAQSAFAEENKKALSMFNELAQVAGIQGPEMDRMRADLIANFAKATGQQNNPFIQKMVSELRKDPARRAADDPQIQRQRAMLEDLQAQQIQATEEANKRSAELQLKVLQEGTDPIVAAFQKAANQITAAVDTLARATGTRPLASGGMVYASKGQLINFQPKGSDTVPAMLTPGEFVVNKKATQKNLGLLRSINNGQSADGNYAVGGIVNSGTPTLDQNTINRAVAGTINNFQGTLNNVDKNTTETNKTLNKQVSQNRLFNKGGVVYASQGQLIGAQPKGTDTVPAMLTPGEFVVNKQAAQKNMGLLKSINGGSKGYSKGGTVYLQRGGSVGRGSGLFEELGPVMGNYYNNAIQQAAMEGRWFITNKEMNTLHNKQGVPRDLDLAQAIEQKNNFASVLAPDARSAVLAAKEYDWFKLEWGSRVIPASRWYTKKYRKLIMDVKKDQAFLYKEAFDREIGKFPKLFEEPNSSIGIAGNKDAFSEVAKLPDPKSKFMTEYVKDPEKAKKIHELLSNRVNFLNLIIKNNEEAWKKFSTSKEGLLQGPMGWAGNFFSQYSKTAKSQAELAVAERGNIFNLAARVPEIRNLPDIDNKFAGSRLFDPSDEAVDLNYENIISRPYNRGGLVYASKGKLINFQSKGTDTVPAMLTPGEFVVNKKSSQENAGLLNAINSGAYSKGGVAYLANGSASYAEQQRLRKEASEQQRAMRVSAYQARRGMLMTGSRPVSNNVVPAQQRQQQNNPQNNNFTIQVGQEAKDFLTTLTTKIDSFGKYVDNLAAIVIPDKIDLNITAQPIEVRITGSAALENMSEGIQNMIASEVNSKMSEIWNQSGGELGSRPA